MQPPLMSPFVLRLVPFDTPYMPLQIIPCQLLSLIISKPVPDFIPLTSSSLSPLHPPPQGFGTVKFHSAEGAQAAIAQWHEQELEGRRLAVFLDKFA